MDYFLSPNTNIVIAMAGEMKIVVLEGGDIILYKPLTRVTLTQCWLLRNLNIHNECIILQRQEAR